MRSHRKKFQWRKAGLATESQSAMKSCMCQPPAPVMHSSPLNMTTPSKLSREAVEDESIPLAHRQAIRKYFELIRPAEK